MGRASTRRALAAALALAAVAAGCRPRVPPPDLSDEAAELRAQVVAAQARVASVQGEARVRIETDDGKGTVTQFLAAQRPDRLRVESLDFFGNPALLLVAADGRFSLYDARSRVLYRGPATPENLARLVPLPLPAEDLVAILCGSAPLLARPVEAAPGRGYMKLVLEEEEGPVRQEVRVGKRAQVERSALRAGGERAPGLYDLAFDAIQWASGTWFPFEVRLEADAPRVRLELRWQDVAVNAPLDPALFALSPPPRGARVVDLEAEPDAGPPNLFDVGAQEPEAAPPPRPGE